MRLRLVLMCLVSAGITLVGLLTVTPPAPAAAVVSVKVGPAVRAIEGCDVRRTSDSLVVYTRAWGRTTRTGRHGFEAAVVRGRVVRVRNSVGDMVIPRRGVVLSARGTSRRWLKRHAEVGAWVVVPRCRPAARPVAPKPTPDPTPAPTPAPTPTQSPDPPTPSPSPPPVTQPGPEPVLPDLGMRGVSDVSLDLTSAPGRRRLRFTATIVNAGEGRLEVTGTRSDTGSEMSTVQRIFRTDGTSSTWETDAWMYFAGDGHHHWHVRDLASYDLYDLTPEIPVGTQAKHGFCFYDNAVFRSTQPRSYTTCGTDANVLTQTMGISPGWGDRYSAAITDQYIDVTELPPGVYRMRLTADADDWFTESDETNNGNWADIEITDTTATVLQRGGHVF